MKKHVEVLMKKASDAHSADDALKFSQAACNVANAMRALDGLSEGGKPN